MIQILFLSPLTDSCASGFCLRVSLHCQLLNSHRRPHTHPDRLGLAAARANKQSGHVHVHEGEETRHTPKHTCQRQLSPGDTPRESCSYCQHTGWELCHSSLDITVTSSSALFPNHCSCSADGQI